MISRNAVYFLQMEYFLQLEYFQMHKPQTKSNGCRYKNYVNYSSSLYLSEPQKGSRANKLVPLSYFIATFIVFHRIKSVTIPNIQEQRCLQRGESKSQDDSYNYTIKALSFLCVSHKQVFEHTVTATWSHSILTFNSQRPPWKSL